MSYHGTGDLTRV
ncbi:hypothetical protein LEMLEM_LOCUS12644 [Lemmus lemmus]